MLSDTGGGYNPINIAGGINPSTTNNTPAIKPTDDTNTVDPLLDENISSEELNSVPSAYLDSKNNPYLDANLLNQTTTLLSASLMSKVAFGLQKTVVPNVSYKAEFAPISESPKISEQTVESKAETHIDVTQPKIEKPKVEEAPKPIDESKNIQNITSNLQIYGYPIAQKILNLGTRVKDLKGLGDVDESKTWVIMLVNKLYEKKAIENKKL